MKKKLIAAAVVSAFAAPVAFAQTPAANVTIYGTLQSEFISVSGDGEGAPDFERRNRIGTPGSFFIGFRGQERVGGGMSVIWQVEQNVGGGDGTGTANTWGSRNTFVGLAGGFGQIMLGHHDSPMKRVLGVNNVMNMGLTGPNGMEPVLTNNGNANRFSWRITDSLTYISPSMSGFRVEAQYQANESKTATNVGVQQNAYNYGVALRYDGGPFRAGLAYAKNNDIRGAGLDDNAILVSGSWTSGPFLVHAAYSRLEYDAPVGNDTTRDNFLVGAQYSLGMHRFRAQYQNAGDTKGATQGVIGTLAVAGGDTGAQVYGLSYGYALSKRSEVYALFSYIDNDRRGLVNHSGGHGAAGAFTAGMDVTAYGVGIRHSF